MTVRAAYEATAGAWAEGPERVYAGLAEHLVRASPVPLAGRLLLDIGAGTGAASRAASAAGARVVAVDLAHAMLAHDRADRPPAAVADALALPFRSAGVDGAVAAFSLNHLTDPAAALREIARVCRPGSPVLVSAYADDDTHPVKDAVERAATEAGWTIDPWYQALKRDAVVHLAQAERAEAMAAAAGLDGHAVNDRISFPHLGPVDLVAWRLGMAQVAPFVATLPPAARAALTARALALLGPAPPPLVRSVVVLTAVTSAS